MYVRQSRHPGAHCSVLTSEVFRFSQRRLGFGKFAFKVNALVYFLSEHLIDLRKILRRIVDFYFELIGSLQRLGYIADLYVVRQFVL